MADATTVVEGKVKFRDGKKWKSRWCVLKKPSPVADRLQLVLFKDVHEALRAGGKVKSSFPLDGYCGLESGFTLDRETNVLAILCQKQITLLAFDTREYLIQFEVKIRRSMGQEYQFPVRVVKVPSGSRVPLEGVKLLIHGCRFCLTAQIPPRILQTWNVGDLRRYGAVDGKFCFEGGSKCGKGVGGHAVQTEQAEEISEILRLNSLGKSSTAQSSNNRNSQLLDYSLVTPDSVWSQDRTGPGASAVGVDQSSHLACCQGLPAGAEADEWGCRKRHSVNVTEYHRASVATFQEKLRQMSLENQERQRLMAIYDVPPKHPRKLETVSDTGSTHQPKEDESAASSVDPVSGAGILEPGLKATSGLTVRLDPDTAASQGEVGQSPAASQSRRVIVTSVAGREYCIPRSLNTSVFDSIVNAQVDTTKRKEALQSLHKQETHLRQEIDLLDQMLKVCHPHSEEPAPQTQSGEESSTDNMDPWQERISTLEPPLQCSTPNHVAKKTASLPPKIGSEDAETEEPANSPMSPNLLSKLEKIPWNSSLNAPLPYVNLAKYDAETDSGFIYLQGGSEADSGYMAAVPKLHRNPAGGSMASLRHRALMGVPSRSFSETHIGPGKVVGCSLQAPQKPLPLPPKEESEDDLTCESEDQSPQSPLSDTLLEEDYLMPPTTYAPPVPYPRVLTTMSATSASTSVTDAAPLSDYTPLSAASTATPEKPVLIREPIYANEPPPLPPPRCKLNTPPPELPPKGPALLQRSKLRSSGTGASISTTVPPAPPVRTRSLSVGSQGGRSSESDKAVSGSPPVAVREVKKSSGEQAYLPMGSPQSPARRVHVDSNKGGDSRPSSFYSSPKTRPKGIVVANRRGNAEVLSGYMDMANMFMEEPKHGQGENVNTSGSESVCTPELHITEPIVDCSSETHADSNYMEMSNFPVQPKSTVLKNLEALQTYISITSGGETIPKSGSSSCPGTPSRSNTSSTSDVPTPNTPPTKAKSKLHRKVVTSSTANSSDENVFTISSVEGEDLSTNKSVRCVSSSSKARPAIPFTNLKNFEQKQSKSYVNTYIPAPEVPLPEPPKKEEGFFARLMRRNSKDKSTSKSQESLNQQKYRTSVFERSISEQGEVVEEKTLTKLKSGRRRSASFPNRLSFHETAGSEGTATPTKADAPPPLPPSIKSSSSVKSSSSTKSSSSVKSISSLKSSPSTKSCSSSAKSSSKQSRTSPEDVSSKPQPDNRSDNSSLHDLSDDSDRAPLLRQGNNNSELRVLTVLHVQQELNVSPLAQVCTHLTSCSSSDPLFSKYGDSCSKLSDSSISLSDCSKATSFDSCKTALSDSSKAALSDSSKTELSDSSKTDDEKLIELLKCGQKPPESAEADDVKSQTNLDHDQQSVTNAQEEAAAIARHVASVPPLIPPKNKRLPLSPVSEVSSPGTLSLSSVSPSSPPQHPLLPSAPNQDEAIYVDMKELFPQPPPASASASAAAHLHPYNCPREQKERARATLRITPALEDEEGNIWVPRHDAGEARSRPVTVFESPPPVPSLSSKLHPLPAFSHPSPRLGGEAPSSLFELRYTTPLVVSVDPLEGAGEGLAEPLSMSSQGSCPSLRSLDDAIIRASPAATVLRPRSGRDYQVVERRRLGSESLSSSSATQSPTYSSVFTYEASPLPHKSPASHSMFSWQSRENASPCQAMSTGPSTPLSRERTPPTPSSASLSLSKEPTPSPRVHARRDTPLPVPPRRVRACHRAHSEPWSGRTDFPRVVCHSSKSSPPTTPQAPISPLALPAETPQPTLNYAEIDLTAMASTPPPVELTRHFSRWQKKAPPKAVAIEYTQIDHTATTALKMAGEEHTQSREVNNSLRRGAAPMSLARKNSAPASTKDRKYSTFGGERKLSTCSMDSI